MYYEWIQQHKRTIVTLTTIIFTGLILWSVVTLVSRQGKVPVTVSAVPRDATVHINDSKTGSGTHWLMPGKYTIRAEKEGFSTRTKTIEVTDKKEHNVAALSLTAESDEAKQWAERHENEYLKNQEYGALEARANGRYFKERHPVTGVLPFQDPYYTISYRAEDDQSLTITITTPSPRYRYLAVEKFRSLGYNPTDFRIEFADYTNPLGGTDE